MVGTTPQSKFDLIWLLSVAGLGPTFQTSRQIIRMKKLLPSLTNDLIEETAKILDDPLIDMIKKGQMKTLPGNERSSARKFYALVA